MPALHVVKAHAYGNDFLCVPAADAGGDLPSLARHLPSSSRHRRRWRLLLYTLRDRGASMKLLNADGSWSELSGNGLRCLAALVARSRIFKWAARSRSIPMPGRSLCTCWPATMSAIRFELAMGQPTNLRQATVELRWRVGHGFAARSRQSAVHRARAAAGRRSIQPAGTGPRHTSDVSSRHQRRVRRGRGADRVRILIWERGVGPTTSSGTGSSASAVAAPLMAARRAVDVIAPGGTQRVDWLEDGVHLTGWAEVILGMAIGREGCDRVVPRSRFHVPEPGTRSALRTATFGVAEIATMSRARAS